jgi:Ser-tRNA(Ala) deacylase AlaX
MSAFKLSTVELCIVPGGVGDLDDQEALARDVKEALELYHEEACKTKADARLWKDRIKISVGGDVPACPCCGSKTR